MECVYVCMYRNNMDTVISFVYSCEYITIPINCYNKKKLIIIISFTFSAYNN